jgi:hypothetical protein
MAVRQQQRRGTASQWTAANPILSAAEIGYETDTNKFKIGDGTNRWAALNYFVDLNTTIAGAPGLLNSLDEIAAAIGDDPAFFTTVSTNLSNHQADTTNIHGIANTALLVTQDDLSTALTGATVDQSALAGVGIDWNSTTEAFDIDSTVATKTYADNAASTAVSAVVGAAPAALDTLKELADALTADESTAATLATLVGTKASSAQVATDIAAEATARNTAISTAKNAAEATASADATTKADAAKAFATAADTTLRTAITTDIATAKSEATAAAATDATIKANAAQTAATTAAAADATTKANAANTYTDSTITTAVTNAMETTFNALALKAPLDSPALTGSPTAATAQLGSNSTVLATTAFVRAAIQDISSLNLVLDGGGV